MDRILVRVTESADNQVVLWERHPEHPQGEVFLAGSGEFTVAKTPAVEVRLRDGRLALVQQKGREDAGIGAAVPTAEEGEPVTPATIGDVSPAATRKSSRPRNRGES